MIDGVVLGRPSHARLDQWLRAAESAALSYDHVGSTLTAQRSDSMVDEDLLGSGSDVFERATERLKQWACHDALSARITPVGAPLELGQTLLVTLRVGPVSITVPNRIVAVIDEPDRFGFAYGTLEGHHESGEELFLVERRHGDTVWGRVRADSRVSSTPARLARPFVQQFQRHAIRRYLAGLQE